jgi:hypothetical protein
MDGAPLQDKKMALPLINEDASEKMPYVRFERRAVEDKAASLEAGQYIAKDIDYALITPPYSKDVMVYKVANWFDQLKVDLSNDRLPHEWFDKWKKAYQLWQDGQEMPLEGTAIKGWGVISPAQQETLIKMNVFTVELLADINDEGLRRVGMGALDLKNKAGAWLKQLKSKGPATVEIAELKNKNKQLEGTIESLLSRISSLEKIAKISEQDGVTIMEFPSKKDRIELNEILDE